jgi:hypothetical protein
MEPLFSMESGDMAQTAQEEMAEFACKLGMQLRNICACADVREVGHDKLDLSVLAGQRQDFRDRRQLEWREECFQCE